MAPAFRRSCSRALSFGAMLCVSSLLHAAPKYEIQFPSDSYVKWGSDGGWVKFTILVGNPTTVYFQDSNVYPFHYDFAVAELPQFAGMTRAQFDAATLHAAGQQAILGALILPPRVNYRDVYPEYGLQLVRQDPYPRETVRDLFHLVRSKVLAAPDVQAYYFPAFEQQASAEQEQAWLLAEGVPLSSVDRWAEGNACPSFGWALGRLKYFPAAQIDAAWIAGDLAPGDVLLTDGVPAEIPAVAGVVSLAPVSPNSHVVILARTFRTPLVHLALADDIELAQGLVGHRIVLRADEVPSCRVRLIDVEGALDDSTIQQIVALAAPPALDITPVEPFGAYSANADTLGLGHMRWFGGKASNFGVIRRAIPASSPVATAFSFDLWNAYLNQNLPGGRTLRQEIALRLAPYTWPPNMGALDATLAGIRDLFRSTSLTSFPQQLQNAVRSTLQDPQYGFDPSSNLRFRSSTNVEDAEQFTGAGLYDSFSGCLADDLDSGSGGPSLCDPTESEERGVFRAIRRVYASFYNLNAYLERLRHGVDETQVGMALLVHHSFPDSIELANGVGLARRSGATSYDAELVTQLGASSVTNPEPGAFSEEMWTHVGGLGNWTTLIRPSNLVQLGATVMDRPADYSNLTSLLGSVWQRYALESGLSGFTLDFEYKKLSPDGRLSVDQVRRLPPADNTPSITPFLVNRPADYCLIQTVLSDVFTNHRLKSRWGLSTRNMWLTPENLASSLFADASLEYAESCQLYEQTGSVPDWPMASHGYSPDPYTCGGGPAPSSCVTSTDGFQHVSLQNPRTYTLSTFGIPTLVAPSRSPVLVLGDFGQGDPLRSPDGCLELRVDYAQPVPAYDSFNQLISTTTDSAWLCRCPAPLAGDVPLQRTLAGPAGASIVTRYSWRYLPELGGITGPLVRFVDTTIVGLTSSPIVLTDVYSQTYGPNNHNTPEHFLFEPALAPDLPATQRAELQALGIRGIHVRYEFGVSTFTYYGDELWGGSCLDCAGFDADDDGACTGAPTYDCNDADGAIWARPGEVRDFEFTGKQTMIWNPPADPGASVVLYDVIRSSSPWDFASAATCGTTDVAGPPASAPATPAPGQVFFYLARAQNACPGGVGPAGFGSDGSERLARSCP